MKRVLILLACTLALPACDDEPDGDADADVDGGADADVDADADADADADEVDAEVDAADAEVDAALDADLPPPPACQAISPESISTTVDNVVTILGRGFVDGGSVRLTPVDGGEAVTIAEVSVEADGESATFTVTAGSLPAGLYHLTFVGPDAVELACLGSLLATPLPPPTVTDVVPPYAWAGDVGDGVLSDQRVSVLGEGFLITPSVRFQLVSDSAVRFDATIVNFVDAGSLSAICPSETRSMPVGEYHVYVVNPNGLEGQWMVDDPAAPGTMIPGIFEVTDVPPPRIDEIDPVRSPAADPVTLTVRGAYFQEGAVVSMGRPDAEPLELATTNDATTPDAVLTALIPAGSMAQGPHPVYVTNPDGRFDVYYSYDATPSSSGHLGGFELVDAELVTARERHAVEFGFDVYGRAYLYAAGGLGPDDAAGAPALLDDVEVIGVSLYGDLEQPWVAEQYLSAETPRGPNTMTTPRNGLTLIRVGNTLYAIGGTDQDTRDGAEVVPALASVERATILSYDEMPQPIVPTVEEGSGLPIGTWYYQISALGPWGESLPSRELQVRNEGGRITVCWHPVEGATGYTIYRNFDAAGLSGTTRLMAAGVSSADDCYVDDGRGANQPAPGRLRGGESAGAGLALGAWTYRVSAVVDGVETVAGNRLHVVLDDAANAQVTLRWSTVPDATYNVYRTAAVAVEAYGGEDTYLLAEGLTATEFVDDGTLAVALDRPAPDGVAPLPPGSLGLWQLLPEANDLLTAREGLDGVAITVPSGTDADPDHTYIYVTGGRPDSSGLDYLTSTERAEVLEGGDLGPWEAMPLQMVQARAFFVLLTNIGQRDSNNPPPPVEPPCEDFDGDGHFAEWCGGDDCDDTDPSVYPGAPEICDDGIDQDCDGVDPPCDCDPPEDGDGDGHRRPECGGDDCDDDDPTIYPGATEICGDGIDQNCDGVDPPCDCPDPHDQDGDGHQRAECGGDDCNDLDETIYPGAEEICDDGIDQDCDGRDMPCLIMGRLPEYAESLDLAPGLGARAPLRPLPTIAEGPIYLIACQGDDEWAGGSNDGTVTLEVTEIEEGTGALLGWANQPDATLSGGQQTHGHGALLYFDYVFIMKGVQTETLDAFPSPYNSTATRFVYDETAAAPDEIVAERQSTSAAFIVPRAYFGMTRLVSFIFAVGGDGGTGPLSTIERMHQ